jgi:hypothetical protein
MIYKWQTQGIKYHDLLEKFKLKHQGDRNTYLLDWLKLEILIEISVNLAVEQV